MVAYPDTSFLVPLYVLQEESPRALAFMRRWRGPMIYTSLHHHELRNAVRLVAFRKEITGDQCRQALGAIDSDLEDGILAHHPIPWNETFQSAERLSASSTEGLGNRGIDILHVASALTLGAKNFLTFDKRQRALAESLALKLPV